MGAAPSSGRNNDELVDNLADNSYLRYRSTELAFRLVDRGDYFPSDKRDNAYKDLAWRSEDGTPGFIHLSAPCIYANALEFLDFRPGLAFLNIGSGTGYFNAVAGYLLTETGVNHGVELHENLIQYANGILQTAIKRHATSAFSFCAPEFFHGSAFMIQNQMKYDRIYCGAQVPPNRRVFFCRMLKINGILVMPYGSRLIQVTRKDENEFVVYRISNVSFSQLIAPNSELPMQECRLPDTSVKSLLEMCRIAIRKSVRDVVFQTNPVQVQFEVNTSEETNNGHTEEEGQTERIGTLYFMNEPDEARQQNQPRPNRQPEAEQQENEPEQPVVEEQQPEVEQPDIEAPPPEDFEIPPNEQEAPLPAADQDEAVEENRAEEGAENEEGHANQQAAPGPIQRFALHLQRNARPFRNPANVQGAAPPNGPHHRLRFNLVNGNRIVGFFNPNDDDEELDPDEDLFREAEGRREAIEPLGLAPHDKTTQATFTLSEEKPPLNSVDMKQFIPDYVEPVAVPVKKPKSGQRANASTTTDDARQRRYAVQLAVPARFNRARDPNAHRLRFRPRPNVPPPQPSTSNQPSTSAAPSQQTASATTQTENMEVDETNRQNPRPNVREFRRDLNAEFQTAAHLYRGIRERFETIQRRHQRVRQLFDRLQQNQVNAQPPTESQQSVSTTGATADSVSVVSATDIQPERSNLKRKIENEEPEASTSARTNPSPASDDETTSSSQPKMSRSASLPSYPAPESVVSGGDASLPTRPESPVPSSSSMTGGRSRSPSPNPSVVTSISSISGRTAATVSTTTSGPDSVAASDAPSGIPSSVAATTSSIPNSQLTDTDESASSSGVEENNKEDEQRQSERAERARQFRQSLEEFHTEFQRRLHSLPLSERLIRYIAYEE